MIDMTEATVQNECVLLEMRNVSVSYMLPGGKEFSALNELNLTVRSGQTLAVLGASGAGKSSALLAAAGLLPERALSRGEIRWCGKSLRTKVDFDLARQNGLIAVLQGSGSLNPYLTILSQLNLLLRVHQKLVGRDALAKAHELLHQVELLDSERILGALPSELSGGQVQRVVIAEALACRPRLMIADEPTASLDTLTAAGIADLLARLSNERQMALLIATHDLRTVAQLCSQTIVLQGGQIVEAESTKSILHSPTSIYARKLLDAAFPAANSKRL